jgi:hypothetical protein
MIVKPLKLKTCKQCKIKFIPSKPLQSVCGFTCSLDYTLALKQKKEALESLKERKVTKEKLEKLKSKSEYLKDAQRWFNIWIRKRDESLGCCSCDKQSTWNGQWHASHYRSVGAQASLRFNELNVHKSCSICNNFLSSNAIEYRIRLIKKIGIEQVEWLESEHAPKNYTIDDIKEIKVKYKVLCKELENK